MNVDCPFCSKIINELAFLLSKNFLSIYNRSPILPGHSMIIPKRHYTSMLELTPELRTEMMELSIDSIKLLKKVFKSNSFNWTIQEGGAAGQTEEHLHMHIIPRRERDMTEPGDWYPRLEDSENNDYIDSSLRAKYSIEELKKIVNKIKSYIK